MKLWPIAFVALVACGNQSAATSNAASSATVATARHCDMPTLDFTAADILGETERALFTENFRAALGQACSEGLLEGEQLVDERAHATNTIFVMNAPEANVTSLYFGSSAAPPAMLLESPFGDPPRVLSAEELHEALYCCTKGATEEEQETTGRCLPD